MSTLRSVLVIALVLGAAVPVLAVPINYQATIQVNWSNGYFGDRTTIDNAATVVVDYTGGGNFTITSLTFSANEAGAGTIVLGAAGDTSGTISGGVANGLMGFSGTAAGGAYNLLNTGGQFTGSVANGVAFSNGDVYELKLFNQGTVSPAIAGNGNWDLLSALDDSPETDPGTKIIFGVPEPASLTLLALVVPLVMRRRVSQ